MSYPKCWSAPYNFVDCQGISVRVTTDEGPDPSVCLGNGQGGQNAFNPDDGTASDWYQAGYCSQDLYDYAQGNQGNTATPTNEEQEAVAEEVREEAQSGEPVTISKEDVKAYEEAVRTGRVYVQNSSDEAIGTFYYAGITSPTKKGLLVPPLEFAVVATANISDSQLDEYLESGEMGLYVRRLKNPANAAQTVKRFFGISQEGINSDINSSVDTSGNPALITLSYSDTEVNRLREVFGSPKNTTADNIIDSAIAAAAGQLSLFEGPQRYKSNAVETPAFTNANLSVLTGMESAQGIDVSLTTVSGALGVESTVDYKTGDMY